MSTPKKKRRSFTPEFKYQIVQLYKNGKRKSDIVKEYDLAYSTIERWIEQESNSGSFKEKDNLTPEQKELIELREKMQQLEMENDILKQAAHKFTSKTVFDADISRLLLIMGRKSK